MTYGNSTVFAVSSQELESFQRDGYLIVRGLLRPEEVQAIRERFDAIAQAGEPVPGWAPDHSPASAGNVLARYPRVMMPHRFDDLSLRLLLDARVHDILAALLADEPLAAQTMYYFKPPGAKGQAFHQDDFYLKTKPGACMAAWFAIDPSVTENGGLSVVPGSHKLDVQCPETADPEVSFSIHLVPPPAGMTPVPADLAPGDCLFFGGALIHGSPPNRSTGWRRSFISHYVPSGASHVSNWYFPLLDFDGHVVERRHNDEGGPCGVEFK